MPGCRYAGIKLTQRTRGGIARIGEFLVALGQLLLIQPLKIFFNINTSPRDFQQRGG
jgi:hypothetical protein